MAARILQHCLVFVTSEARCFSRLLCISQSSAHNHPHVTIIASMFRCYFKHVFVEKSRLADTRSNTFCTEKTVMKWIRTPAVLQGTPAHVEPMSTMAETAFQVTRF